jgi:NAD(P)H-dependent FMN reductase
MFIPVILGTARIGRRSDDVANWVLSKVKDANIDTLLMDVRDYPLNATDNTLTTESSKRYASIIEKADALIVVTPEYNHGYPGELKLMLDLAYTQYFKKPVGLCGVSISSWGGVRCIEKLRSVFIELHMVPIRESLYFPNVGEMFSEGRFADDKVKSDYDRMFGKFIGELSWYANSLKYSREQ